MPLSRGLKKATEILQSCVGIYSESGAVVFLENCQLADCLMAVNRFPETLLSEMFLVSMMITDFSFCSGVASLGSDCMLSWSLWMFRWFWIVNHQNCCSNNSSFMAGRVKHLCQEWSITIWLVLIKFWQVPWNVRLREWPIIGNGEARPSASR